MVVYCNEVECHAERYTIFDVKVTTRAYIIKIWLFLQYLLSNQTWFHSVAWEAGVFCGKTGVLHSRSRSQQRFSMLVNVWPDDAFWTAEYFVTKFGMVMQRHEPECHVEKKKSFTSWRSKVTARAHMIKILLFLLYLLNCWFLCNQTWCIIISQKV